jgi:Tol biopolymer transport system component
LNGVALPAATVPRRPFLLAPNGKALAYVGSPKGIAKHVYNAGKPGPELSGDPDSLTLSADGKTVAYRVGNTALVVNSAFVKEMDAKDPPCWKGPPVISPDGKKVAFATLRPGSGLWWRVVDAK